MDENDNSTGVQGHVTKRGHYDLNTGNVLLSLFVAIIKTFSGGMLRVFPKSLQSSLLLNGQNCFILNDRCIL